MSFTINYKGKNFTEEEISQRIATGLSLESAYKKCLREE